MPREARGHPRVARDVAPLLSRLGDAAADDVVDYLGVDPRALDQALQREPEQVGGVPVAEGAVALAERRPHDVDDDRLTNLHRASPERTLTRQLG